MSNTTTEMHKGTLKPFFDSMIMSSGLLESMVDEMYIDLNHSDYNFRVNNSDDINFKKIADDLSYADPLRIVEFGDKMWAVVHHTIQDKYLRSKLKDKGIRIEAAFAISRGVGSIEKKDIKSIVNVIREIKQAQWSWDNRRSYGNKLIVEVKKVKI